MRKRYVLLTLAFLLVLMCEQGVIATVAPAVNARAMFVTLVGLFAVALAVLLTLLCALLVRTAAAEHWERKRRYAILTSRHDLCTRGEGVTSSLMMSAHPDVAMPEAHDRLRRLLAIRRDYAAQSLTELALRDRILVCQKALHDVTEPWIGDEIGLHLLALGPIDDFLLEVWRLEEEVVACRILVHRKAPPSMDDGLPILEMAA